MLGLNEARKFETLPDEPVTCAIPKPYFSHRLLVPSKCRQLSGECGVPESDLQTWTATFDKLARGDETSGGRSQLNLWVCAPFGDYELEIETDSFSEGTTASEGRTSWEILRGDGVSGRCFR